MILEMATKLDLERVKRSKIKDQILGQLGDLSAGRAVCATRSLSYRPCRAPRSKDEILSG
jgi:hypothetical protein